jgi:polysaccharide biosynthesis transport protein
MLGETEIVATGKAIRSGRAVAHKPYIGAHQTQSEFRALRQKIRLLLSESATIAVCATAPGEGASWTAAMLACATAEEGDPVVLVDADVRNPKQASEFELMDERMFLPPSIIETGFAFHGTSSRQILLLIPSGMPDYSEREAGASLRSVLPALRTHSKNVVVDCPPIPSSGLLLDIAPVVDGVILVVKAERERRDEIKQKIDWLKRMSPPLLGVIFNKGKGHLPGLLERAL